MCCRSCHVIHNFCITFDDLTEYEENTEDEDFDPQFVENISGIMPRVSKRDAIFRTMFG